MARDYFSSGHEEKNDSFKYRVTIVIARVNYVIKSTMFTITLGYLHVHSIFIPNRCGSFLNTQYKKNPKNYKSD